MPHEIFGNFCVYLKSQVCFTAVKTLSLIGQLQTETQVSYSLTKKIMYNTFKMTHKYFYIF